MAVTRRFNGKIYRYAGSDKREFEIKEQAGKLRKRGKSVRIAKTGKGLDTLYTLYVRG